jgi:hypothetical protein
MHKTLLILIALVAVAAGALGAGLASGASDTTQQAGNGPVLLGDTSLAQTMDTNGAGNAQAWTYTASATGTATDVEVYVTPGSNASALTVGLYSTDSGKPNALLASGSESTVTNGAWNDINVGNFKVTAGTNYAVAVLSAGGALGFRDNQTGDCNTWTSASSSLTDLPAQWSTGVQFDGFCSASLYVSGTTPVTTTSTTTTPTSSSATTTTTSTTVTAPPVTTSTTTGQAPPSTRSTNCAPTAANALTNTVSHTCGFADTTNTGVPGGTTLVNVPGQITAPTAQTGSGWTFSSSNNTITLSAGGVVKNVQLTGGVNVIGSNATVEDSDITCPGDSCWTVQLRHANNTTITNNNLHGQDSSPGDGCDSGIRDIYGDSDGLDATNNNIWYCTTGFNNIGGGGTISNNYIHNFAFSDSDSSNHFDGIQAEDGDGQATLIQDNTILLDNDQTSPIILSNDGGGTEANRTIDHNLLAGGDYCFYGSGGDSNAATGITFENNHMTGLYFPDCGYYGETAYWQSGNGNVFSGNVWDSTGAALTP